MVFEQVTNIKLLQKVASQSQSASNMAQITQLSAVYNDYHNMFKKKQCPSYRIRHMCFFCTCFPFLDLFHVQKRGFSAYFPPLSPVFPPKTTSWILFRTTAGSTAPQSRSKGLVFNHQKQSKTKTVCFLLKNKNCFCVCFIFCVFNMFLV